MGETDSVPELGVPQHSSGAGGAAAQFLNRGAAAQFWSWGYRSRVCERVVLLLSALQDCKHALSQQLIDCQVSTPKYHSAGRLEESIFA